MVASLSTLVLAAAALAAVPQQTESRALREVRNRAVAASDADAVYLGGLVIDAPHTLRSLANTDGRTFAGVTGADAPSQEGGAGEGSSEGGTEAGSGEGGSEGGTEGGTGEGGAEGGTEGGTEGVTEGVTEGGTEGSEGGSEGEVEGQEGGEGGQEGSGGEDLSSGATAGIAIAVIAGVAALAALVAGVVWKRKKAKHGGSEMGRTASGYVQGTEYSTSTV